MDSWHINHWRLFNAKSILYIQTVLFGTIQFIITTQFKYKNSSISNGSVNIRTMFRSISPIDRTLLGSTTPSKSGPRSDSNEGILCIPLHYWNLTIILFYVICRTLLPLFRDAVGVFYSPSRLGTIRFGWLLYHTNHCSFMEVPVV